MIKCQWAFPRLYKLSQQFTRWFMCSIKSSLQHCSPLIIHNVSLGLTSHFSPSDIHYPAFCREVCPICTDCCWSVFNSTLYGRVSQDALAELKALINIMQSSVEQIEATVTANSFNFPSPDSQFSFESEAPRMHPEIQSAGALITSAASQLITLVRPAPLTLLDITLQVKPTVHWGSEYCSPKAHEVPRCYCTKDCG
jgi:hypothetical protein